MAKFIASELGLFALDMEKLAGLPEEVVDRMVLAQGEVIKKGQEASARTMLQGPYYKGGVADGIRLGKVKRMADGKAAYISFTGKQHGNDLTEIAFVNEFGKRNQPARPFIKTANEKNAEAAVEAAAAVYDEYLKKNNL